MEKLTRILYFTELYTTQQLSLSGENYLVWKTKLSFILNDLDLEHVLKPSPVSPPTKTWLQENSSAILYIIGTLHKDHFGCFGLPLLWGLDSYIVDPNPDVTAKNIMDELHSEFGTQDFVRRLSLCRDYKDCRMSADGNITGHVFRMAAMVKKLEFYGVEFSDETQAVMLMKSMPEEWEHDLERVMFDLSSGTEKLSFDNVSRRLRSVGDIREWREAEASFKRGLKPNCDDCRKYGHFTRNCPQEGMQDRSHNYREWSGVRANRKETLCFSLKTESRLGYSQSSYKTYRYTILELFDSFGIAHILLATKPVEPSKTAVEDDVSHYKKWVEDDFQGRQIVLAGMDDDLFLTYYEYPSVRDIMASLEICFDFPSIARGMLVLKTYTDHQMFEDTDTAIQNHIRDQKIIVDELIGAGIRVPDDMKAAVLMDGLPDSFKREVRLLLIRENGNDLTLRDVHEKVRTVGEWMDFDRKHKWPDDRPNKRTKRRYRGNCYSCGRSGHYKSECPYA